MAAAGLLDTAVVDAGLGAGAVRIGAAHVVADDVRRRHVVEGAAGVLAAAEACQHA